MAYLISHIFLCLVLAQLLGLLLGWLLWGYSSRQRGKEVQTLRERLADMHFMSARLSMSPEPRRSLDEVSDSRPRTFQGVLTSSEMPERPARRAFFEEEAEEPAGRILSSPTEGTVIPTTAVFDYPTTGTAGPPPISPDLEAEVRESKIQHLQQQVRELEGYRDRLPLLQADVSDAIAGRRSAEARFQEAKNDFDVRSSGLLSQIRNFEIAASEWDRLREEFEHGKLGHEKELASVKATLRDLQNSQLPQTVDTAPAVTASELADMRERLQKAVQERESLASELGTLKQGTGVRADNASRVAELEEAVHGRDSQLSEQAARLESLLWRVAELEPFAAEMPQKEEALRRQESEIAGHMAMHAENADRLHSLHSELDELHATTVPSEDLQRMIAEHGAAIQSLTAEHQQRAEELEHALAMKDGEIAEHVSTHHEHINLLNGLQTRVLELEDASQRVKELEQSLTNRDREHQENTEGLRTAHEQHVNAMQAELEQSHASAMGSVTERVTALEQSLTDRDREHQEDTDGLRAAHERHANAMRAELEQSHASAMASVTERVTALEQSLSEREGKLNALQSSHDETKRELDAARSEVQAQRHEAETRSDELATWKAKAAEAEATVSRQTSELERLREQNNNKDGHLTFLQERVSALSGRLTAHQQRLLQLEPLAARTPEMEQKLQTMETKHHTEMTRLKVNSSQRIRRFRQSIRTFKT